MHDATIRGPHRRHRPASGDAAITVVDAAQGQGLGGALLARLAERAREEGVERISAHVLDENRSMVVMLVHRGARPGPGGWAEVRHVELLLSAQPGVEPGREAGRRPAGAGRPGAHVLSKHS